MSHIYIEVVNPKGLQVTIDESRWTELSKKGYQKVGNSFTQPHIVEDGEFLDVEEI